MDNNYNIKLDPENLSSDQIDKHKDFDALLNQYQGASTPKQASYKKLYYIIGGIAAALIGIVLFYNINSNTEISDQFSTKAYLASQPYVNPPIEDIQKPFAEGIIEDASIGGSYEFPNGSIVTVPETAFLDQQGNPVSGPVEIKYREYHDFVDFFVSGIPMEYDSAGTQYNLESAGMIEIYAEQNGERLNIAPDKNINVALVSEVMVPANDRANIPDFNIYKLDTLKRNWVYEGRDEITVLEEDVTGLLNISPSEAPALESVLAKINQKEVNQLAAIEASAPKPSKPVQPVKENGTDYVFNLNFAEDDIDFGSRSNMTEAETELDRTQDELNQLRRLYANTLWQVAPGQTDFNQEMVSQIDWDDAKIERLNNRDYKLTLINPNRTLEVIVNPVLSEDDFENAMTDFNQQMNDYQQQIATREADLKAKKEALAKQIQEERAIAEKSYEEQLAYYNEKGNLTKTTDLMITNKVLNNFNISEFGIWNCDRPLPPFIYNLKGEFVENKTKKQFKHNTAYLVDKNKNTVMRFYASENANVMFDGNSENMLWMITDENKIAMYTPEQFQQISQGTKKHTFVMDMIDEPIASEEDLRKILVF